MAAVSATPTERHRAQVAEGRGVTPAGARFRQVDWLWYLTWLTSGVVWHEKGKKKFSFFLAAGGVVTGEIHARPLVHPLRMVAEMFTKPVEMIRHMYRTEGLTALWKGLGPNLVGIVPSRAIYFGTYSQGKGMFTELNGGQENSLIHLGAAAIAGVTVATVTCPLWVVKTRMQLQSTAQKYSAQSKPGDAIPYKNSIDCVKRVILEEGAKGLYKGLGASYLGVIESSLQFVLYERAKVWVRGYREKHSSSLVPPRMQGLSRCLLLALFSCGDELFLFLAFCRMDRLFYDCSGIKVGGRADNLPPRSGADENA